MEASAVDLRSHSFSIKLWPPSENTRLMLIERMTRNLCTETIFSRKYGLLSEEEAANNAKRIEEACFSSASEFFMKEPDGDGSSAVQFYAKETSKMMLEVLKRGPSSKEEPERGVVDNVSVPCDTVLDISGGSRAFIEAEEAVKLLCPLAKQGNSYKKICLSNRSFSIEAAHAVESILMAASKQLTEVDLSDIVAGRPEDEAIDVMRTFSTALKECSLNYLNLSNNALGEKGVRAFEALLKSQKNLQELYLINDGISEEAAQALCELIPTTEKLKILHFHNNMTGDEGAVAISKILHRSPLLEDFRCSSTRVCSDGGVALAEALATCTRLNKLDLRDNLFGMEAAKALSRTLCKLTGITEVYLSYLNLEDEGTITILNSLKEAVPSLEVLELAGNEITVGAIPQLVESLSAMRSLKKLSLAENELKDEGAIKIGRMLEEIHMHLTELDFSANMVKRAGARSLAQAVSNKPEFVLLNINGNAIPDEGIDEVKAILKSGKNSVDVLGPLDENDADGDGEEEEDDDDYNAGDEAADVDENGLEEKLEHLKVTQE